MKFFSSPPPEHPLSDFAPGMPVCARINRRGAGLTKGEPFRIVGFIEVEGQKWVHAANAERTVALRASDLCFPDEC